MSIVEEKRLIATFMNYADGKPLTDELLLILYNDWNSIMPVVEKIETFVFDGDEYYNFQILGGCCVYIISSHGNELVTVDNGISKLDCVYKSVVQFIQWYNKQK